MICKIDLNAKIIYDMFTKTQSVESAKVLTIAEHDRISKGLRKLGKASVKDLDEDERKLLLDSSE